MVILSTLYPVSSPLLFIPQESHSKAGPATLSQWDSVSPPKKNKRQVAAKYDVNLSHRRQNQNWHPQGGQACCHLCNTFEARGQKSITCSSRVFNSIKRKLYWFWFPIKLISTEEVFILVHIWNWSNLSARVTMFTRFTRFKMFTNFICFSSFTIYPGFNCLFFYFRIFIEFTVFICFMLMAMVLSMEFVHVCKKWLMWYNWWSWTSGSRAPWCHWWWCWGWSFRLLRAQREMRD